MHKLANGTWIEDRIPPERRPKALPEDWGAWPLCRDVTECWGQQWRRETEPLSTLAMTAFQYMMTNGPPWTCFVVNQFEPWPTYEGEKPTGTEPMWRAFDVDTYADFLAHYEGGLPPDRVIEILLQMDLFADYMVAAGAIDEQLRCQWVVRTQEIISELEMKIASRRRKRRKAG
jgi:hypothetical protein